MRAVAARLRTMAEATGGVVARARSVIGAVADQLAAADPSGDALAAELRSFADRFETVAPVIASGLRAAADSMAAAARGQAVTDAQLERTHRVRVRTAAWSPELVASHAQGGTPERERLFAFVRELFGHPYDTSWWEAPLLAWVGMAGNAQRLEQYIRARNSGRTHEHH